MERTNRTLTGHPAKSGRIPACGCVDRILEHVVRVPGELPMRQASGRHAHARRWNSARWNKAASVSTPVSLYDHLHPPGGPRMATAT